MVSKDSRSHQGTDVLIGESHRRRAQKERKEIKQKIASIDNMLPNPVSAVNRL